MDTLPPPAYIVTVRVWGVNCSTALARTY